VRAVGRTAIGVRGMKLKDDEIVSAIIADDSTTGYHKDKLILCKFSNWQDGINNFIFF
jgi:DNA gyrase/topoisomerase IV subunit A